MVFNNYLERCLQPMAWHKNLNDYGKIIRLMYVDVDLDAVLLYVSVRLDRELPSIPQTWRKHERELFKFWLRLNRAEWLSACVLLLHARLRQHTANTSRIIRHLQLVSISRHRLAAVSSITNRIRINTSFPYYEL